VNLVTKMKGRTLYPRDMLLGGADEATDVKMEFHRSFSGSQAHNRG